MKFLVAGLGNYHIDYVHTRHNIGFDVIDHLASLKGTPFESGRLADHCELRIKGRNIHLIKPTTYMNLSGKSVHYWLQKLKIPLDQLLVVVDDVNLPLGKLRLRASGSDGGHNGLSNIIEKVGTRQFPRLRFGIGDDYARGRQVDFVLGKWTEEEMSVLEDRIPLAGEAILSFVMQGLNHSMNVFNNK